MDCVFPPGFDRSSFFERLGRVLDPELDESILELGFVRSIEVRADEATVDLELPTNWCAVNFAFLMAEDIRDGLLKLDGIHKVMVRLGDHFAANAIESSVNDGKSFGDGFPSEGGGNLNFLRSDFFRKGFIVRQGRLLQALRAASFSAESICNLRLSDTSVQEDQFAARAADQGWRIAGEADTLRRYLERRKELGFDCAPTAYLTVDLCGRPLPENQVEAHYAKARTVRVALEANGSFCRAVLEARGQTAATSDKIKHH
jgi:metal-sulfur cluster biosynthetic enzyme